MKYIIWDSKTKKTVGKSSKKYVDVRKACNSANRLYGGGVLRESQRFIVMEVKENGDE